MKLELALKPDFARSLQRFEAWWDQEIIDRPPVILHVEGKAPSGRSVEGESPEQLRANWMDVDAVIDRQIASVVASTYPGDAIPGVMANVGPDLTSTLWGVDLAFGPNTSWAVHTVNELSDWRAYLERGPDFSNPYWQAIEAMTTRAHELNKGRYLVLLPDLHGTYDILAGLRGPENLCLDLMDDPELIDAVAMNAAETYVQALRRCHETILGLGYPSSTWLPYLHDGPAYVPSCDFWCLVSDDMARRYVLKTVEREMEDLERSIFHLDGPDALRHLDLLLDMPDLDAVQWVYGAGNGPALKWLEVYRRIVQAGKSAHVVCENADEALIILRELGPRGLFLHIGEAFADADAADRYLDEVKKLSRK